MTENDDGLLPNVRSPGARLRLSHDTGESSTTEDTSGRSPRASTSPREDRGSHAHTAKAKKGHKHRSSGGFLLQDAVAVEDGDQTDKRLKRHSRLLGLRGRASPGAAEKIPGSAGKEAGLGIADDYSSSPKSPTEAAAKLDRQKNRKTKAGHDGAAPAPAPPTAAPLDVESAQIVDMALRISESRRRATQRPVSQPLPPRLAPLPADTTQGSSLRQHLLQQRKVSRTGSPRPDKGMLPRSASGIRPVSAFVGSYDGGHDATYRYHFSPSTLARAQKAREHIELMAQYRRLLDLVPPLRTSIGDPPGSPTTSSRASFGGRDSQKLGRQYNPLQYIRNRKVRARERQAVDGESQGFGNIARVTDWVDHVAKWAATGGPNGGEGQSLPPFLSADSFEQDASTSASSQAGQLNRRRVDWTMQPVDLMADAYWLEQGHNKQLIEDRHWNRIYPQAMDSSLRPLSRHIEEPSLDTTPHSTKEATEPDSPADGNKLAKTDTEHSHGSTRERARQKLQDITGFHHRHNSSVHSHHDFLRKRRGSISDQSESDSEFKDRRYRSGTITATSKDILEKQMIDLIAKEERENELRRQGPRRERPIQPRMDLEKGPKLPPSQLHSSRGSTADVSEAEEKPAKSTRAQSPYRRHRGQPTLDVPIARHRPSLEIDTSIPNSPELRASGASRDLTPASSRPGTPTRNPFSKVKQIIRERSRERSRERISMDAIRVEEFGMPLISPNGEMLYSPTERNKSRSPARKPPTRGTGESNRGHRSGPGLGFREERPNGIRGMFRGSGARIDNVIRGGVSKIGDLIWRRDSTSLPPDPSMSEGTVTDESETEQRGRQRTSMPSHRGSRRAPIPEEMLQGGSKSFLDQMPSFQNPDVLKSNGSNGTTETLPTRPPLSREISTQSNQIAGLRPPGLNEKRRSSSNGSAMGLRDSDVSDTDSHRKPRKTDGVLAADRRLGSMLNMPPSFMSSRRTVGRQASWTRPDMEGSREHAPISKREIARLRALILSSGIKAMEISRRANEPQRLFATDQLPASGHTRPGESKPVHWPDIASLSPDPAALRNRAVVQRDMYPLAARTLGAAIQAAGQKWQDQADVFASETSPALQRDVDGLRTLLIADLTAKARKAADEADETSRDLALGQRLKIKRVVDVIEKMGRRRRRRFRWVRRGMWLGVEWVLVGFMWYVWFVVMVLRLVLGVGSGLVRGVRWLLWL